MTPALPGWDTLPVVPLPRREGTWISAVALIEYVTPISHLLPVCHNLIRGDDTSLCPLHALFYEGFTWLPFQVTDNFIFFPKSHLFLSSSFSFPHLFKHLLTIFQWQFCMYELLNKLFDWLIHKRINPSHAAHRQRSVHHVTHVDKQSNT